MTTTLSRPLATPLLPKTFYVVVHDFLGFGVAMRLGFFVHAETWSSVLERVEAMFPGIDIRPTVRRKNAAPGTIPRRESDDPVVVHDVDDLPITKRVDRKIVSTPAPAGHWRRTTDDVVNNLEKIATTLRDYSKIFESHFQDLRQQYEEGSASGSTCDRLLCIKATIERLDVWHDNVWCEYSAIRSRRRLDMPNRRVDVGN